MLKGTGSNDFIEQITAYEIVRALNQSGSSVGQLWGIPRCERNIRHLGFFCSTTDNNCIVFTTYFIVLYLNIYILN